MVQFQPVRFSVMTINIQIMNIFEGLIMEYFIKLITIVAVVAFLTLLIMSIVINL